METKQFFFSVIIPVYNRPGEVDELLGSLTLQHKGTRFEVLIVEDGSENDARAVVDKYTDRLDVHYFAKPNQGPALTRNYGAGRAQGNYFVFFDSDCIIPKNYFQEVSQQLRTHYTDAYGGPDMAHPAFTPVQKAISYAMTSFFTTGGIRGGKRKMDKFYPRSFNMGYSREVYQATEGFANMRFGEDVDMSLRILAHDFSTQLIPGAGVYHKRRTNFRQFFKQVHNSGIARINLFKRHPHSLKPVHILPALFVLGTVALLGLSFWCPWALLPLGFYALLLFADALWQEKNLRVATWAVGAAFVQLFGYGTGFLKATWKRLILRKGEFRAFEKNFYE